MPLSVGKQPGHSRSRQEAAGLAVAPAAKLDAESWRRDGFAPAAGAPTRLREPGPFPEDESTILASGRVQHEPPGSIPPQRFDQVAKVIFDLALRNSDQFGQLPRGTKGSREQFGQPLANGQLRNRHGQGPVRWRRCAGCESRKRATPLVAISEGGVQPRTSANRPAMTGPAISGTQTRHRSAGSSPSAPRLAVALAPRRSRVNVTTEP